MLAQFSVTCGQTLSGAMGLEIDSWNFVAHS